MGEGDKKLKTSAFAKDLRINQTEAEIKFWLRVRNRNFEGLKFRRQVKLDSYIVDFVCFEKKLIVEIDGGQHSESQKDQVRDQYFIDQGYRLKRYWNNDVLLNIDGVLEDLKSELPLTRLP